MISIVEGLSARARVIVAGLVLAVFALMLIGPLGLGASALVGAVQNYTVARDASAQIETRLAEFADRKAVLAANNAMPRAQVDAYLDGPAVHARFAARIQALADALRATGVAVSGETRIRERGQSDAVTILTVDLSVSGPLADILGVLSEADFVDLRTEAASFAADGGSGQVRGALRLVQHHAGASVEEGDGDAN